jgi:SAM-dependent methyltransferase
MDQTPPLAGSPDHLSALLRGEFDFLDFGCSAGGSIEMAKRRFRATRGLGIDIAPKKIEAARALGYDAMLYDIAELPGKPCVRFCVMSHFLEHVASRNDVASYIRKACAVSREFVYIQQPYFDADGYLFQRGLKLFWSDWRGHPNCMTTLMFHNILAPLRAEGKIGDFSIHFRHPIKSSSDEAVHSIHSPRDQFEYDAKVHPPKPADDRFEFPVFRETVVWITKPGVAHEAPFSRVRTDQTLYSSVGKVDEVA